MYKFYYHKDTELMYSGRCKITYNKHNYFKQLYKDILSNITPVKHVKEQELTFIKELIMKKIDINDLIFSYEEEPVKIKINYNSKILEKESNHDNYYYRNKEKINEAHKKYNEEHKNEIKEYKKIYNKEQNDKFL